MTDHRLRASSVAKRLSEAQQRVTELTKERDLVFWEMFKEGTSSRAISDLFLVAYVEQGLKPEGISESNVKAAIRRGKDLERIAALEAALDARS